MINRRVFVKGLVAATLASGAFRVSAQEALKLKMVGVTRNDAVFDLYLWMAKELQGRSGGKLTAEVISLPELGLTGFEAVRVTRAGLVDVFDLLPVYVSGDIPAIEGASLPGIYPDFKTAMTANAAFLPAYESFETKLGAKILGMAFYAHQVIYSRRAVKVPGDFKGLKVRVAGTAQAELIKVLGGESVSLSFSEIYPALERGTIDGALTGLGAGKTLKLTEVTKYMVDVNHGPVATLCVISRRTWDRLQKDGQNLLLQLGAEFTKRAADAMNTSYSEGIAWNKSHGMEWIAPSEEVSRLIRKAAIETIVPSWTKRSGGDAVQVFNKYLAKYTGFEAR